MCRRNGTHVSDIAECFVAFIVNVAIFTSSTDVATRAPFQHPTRRLIVRSNELSKPRDWEFKLLHRLEIWQAHRLERCRGASQFSERSDYSKYKSHGFETWWDLRVRLLIEYWYRTKGKGRRKYYTNATNIFYFKYIWPSIQRRIVRIQF